MNELPENELSESTMNNLSLMPIFLRKVYQVKLKKILNSRIEEMIEIEQEPFYVDIESKSDNIDMSSLIHYHEKDAPLLMTYTN